MKILVQQFSIVEPLGLMVIGKAMIDNGLLCRIFFILSFIERNEN